MHRSALVVRLWLLAALASFAAPVALAQERGPAGPNLDAPGYMPPSFPPGPGFMPEAPGIDDWFGELKNAPTEGIAGLAEDRILRIWLKSGSDTADLLVAWAMQAMEDEDYSAALDLLDAAIAMKPDFAEAWNKRATAFYMMDDYGKALVDIQHTLALEPRHFGAISGLGIILHDVGRDEEALVVLRQALALHPFLSNIRELVTRLEKETAADL